jgi:6-pyruvoyltetrahydropterin/6-carboxytetrahydropterin synthase
MREIRCLLPTAPDEKSPQPTNSWAGTSDSSLAGPFYVISAIVEGPVDAATGYVCNIKVIDELLRTEVVSRLFDSKSEISNPLAGSASALRDCYLHTKLRPPASVALRELRLRISPFTRFSVLNGETPMLRLTQSFEFSASHRLFRPELSDAENLRVFGKCSNPAGHGHNYVVEVTVRGTPSEGAGTVTDIGALDRAVKARVIDDFDHKNLNAECPEFAKLNPTVENIALVIWNRLAGRLGECELANVRVWETPKTYAEYSGED